MTKLIMNLFSSINDTSIGDLTYAEIDLKAVEHNIGAIKKLAAKNKFDLPTRPKTVKKLKIPPKLLAVIKSEAYGHGMNEIALILDYLGVDFFAVSDVHEGVRLREAGIKKPILLFESTLPNMARTIINHKLIPTLCTLDLAKALNEYAEQTKKRIWVHVKVDTGMGRLGVWHEDAYDFVKEIFSLKHLIVHGIFTHFPIAETNKRFTQTQIKILYKLIIRLDKNGMVIPFIHAVNSMGLAGYKTHVLNLVRPGLMVYGLCPDVKMQKKLKLKPVMSVKSKVIFLKDIAKGRSISYGRTFIAKKKMKVATVPIGYSDGYPRLLSNKSYVLIDGVRCPLLGQVTMDQIVVDVSKVKKTTLGMPVTILGTEKKESVTADDLAKLAQTINYEIVCNLGMRLPRIYR